MNVADFIKDRRFKVVRVVFTRIKRNRSDYVVDFPSNDFVVQHCQLGFFGQLVENRLLLHNSWDHTADIAKELAGLVSVFRSNKVVLVGQPH